jgi:trehalose 6-phosphate synthase/phosphatase
MVLSSADRTLNKFVAHLSLNVLNGNKVIEVRVKGIDKGSAIAKIIPTARFDFILCIGDDVTDEDMFRQLQATPEAYTIKVGDETSGARYNLYDPAMVQSLLQDIAAHPGLASGLKKIN